MNIDKYFVEPIRENDGCCEVVEDHEAQFWTVYRRDDEGFSKAMFDLCIKDEAEELVQVLEERDALLVQQQNVPQNIPENISNGWANSDPANSALVMLDRIETIDPADDDRIDEVKRLIRLLAASPEGENGE